MTQSSLWLGAEPLILASGSSARAQLLASIAIPFVVVKPQVDEREVEAPLIARQASAREIAQALADAKALNVSRTMQGRFVLGSDQLLEIEGELLHKPEGREGAKAHLRRLSNQTHCLHSAATIARDGLVVAQADDVAHLTMRELTESFIEAYLDAAGEAVLASVGAYQIEGLGQHLFAQVEGNPATIMGLPLFALLKKMRALHLVRA
jgi:septum formation protein